MKVMVERLSYQTGKDGQDSYWHFWVRLFDPSQPVMAISIGGWRYFPQKHRIGSPSVSKGGGKYLNLTILGVDMYERILEAVETALGVEYSGEQAA